MSVRTQEHTIATDTLDNETPGPADEVEMECRYYASKTVVDVVYAASEWELVFSEDGALKRGECEGPRPPAWLPEAVEQVEPGLEIRGAY